MLGHGYLISHFWTFQDEAMFPEQNLRKEEYFSLLFSLFIQRHSDYISPLVEIT